jgi:hypothetical protein
MLSDFEFRNINFFLITSPFQDLTQKPIDVLFLDNIVCAETTIFFDYSALTTHVFFHLTLRLTITRKTQKTTIHIQIKKASSMADPIEIIFF